MSQKGFLNIVIVVGIAVIIGLAGYFVLTKKSQPQTPPVQSTSKQNKNNVQAKIAEINVLLSSAGIEELHDWEATSQCGPRDEFLGYVVTHSQKEIAFEQATKLKLMAMEQGLAVDDWGEKLSPSRPSYSVVGNGWSMRVLADGDLSSVTDGVVKKGGRPEERWYLTPDIPTKERPTDFLYSPLMCG